MSKNQNTNARKRPNIKKIKAEAKKRGHMNCNEKTMLEGLKIKNALQRIYNRAFDKSLSSAECSELQSAMKEFLKVTEKIAPKR